MTREHSVTDTTIFHRFTIMFLSKPTFFHHLKTFIPRTLPPLRHLSFATPEDAAAERRRRKRRLRIEPPLNALRSPTQPRPTPTPNPNAPKLPEHVSLLTGNRLNLHNRILKLIRENDLQEAVLLTRHSVYSNCKPTIFTCNAVMTACYRQSKYAELLNLHRFITQAAIAANIVTYNLIISTYMDCRKIDTAMEQYKQLIDSAPFDPNTTTYRIIINGLVDDGKLDRALEIKDEMISNGFEADPIVYSYLMSGYAKNGDQDGIFGLYDELKGKLGGFVSNGVVYGSVMKGYFLKGMEKEAMECCEDALGGSKIRMSAVAYNSVLDALCKNGKFDVARKVFDEMLEKHDPPKLLTVNPGSYNVMVDGYCTEKRFDDAINLFGRMGKKRCYPDTVSYNNLIEQLCENRLLGKAEELYNGMIEKGASPDEYTFVVLMDTCFKENRHDDAAAYFKTMVESKRRPNLGVYNRLIGALVKVGKVDEAKSFFDMMVPKLRMDDDSYKFIMKALFDVKKHDEVVEIIGKMLREDPLDFSDELREFVREELWKEEREDDLVNLMAEIEREKAEAAAKEAEEAERAKASARAAVSSLLPSKLFGDKGDAEDGDESSGGVVAEMGDGEGEVKV
ncbi:putative tetratricopeptide-like helical domain superfamily [Helianthus annuus]|nr:putative tetratricopeptide-like helical domain superfamily [Helianthus annuus]KAJ0634759.1 putative tetratricopeptide-like helical domain superfamily [Helianthus annuus]KAJ0824432.1 putative tetratricopeptide-like helical domain superfamily [Helianthus annuus]